MMNRNIGVSNRFHTLGYKNRDFIGMKNMLFNSWKPDLSEYEKNMFWYVYTVYLSTVNI
jgi:hypothetical protein